MAKESSGLTQVILVLALAAFLLHGLVLYLSVYRQAAGRGADSGRTGKKRREFAVFFLLALLAAAAFIFLLPPNFVKNSLVTNLLQDEIKPQPIPQDLQGQGFPEGNLRSDGKRRSFGNRGDGRGTNKLEGIPQDQWPGTGQGTGEGLRKQAVRGPRPREQAGRGVRGKLLQRQARSGEGFFFRTRPTS